MIFDFSKILVKYLFVEKYIKKKLFINNIFFTNTNTSFVTFSLLFHVRVQNKLLIIYRMNPRGVLGDDLAPSLP